MIFHNLKRSFDRSVLTLYAEDSAHFGDGSGVT